MTRESNEQIQIEMHVQHNIITPDPADLYATHSWKVKCLVVLV